MRTRTRWMCLIVVGLVGTTVAVGASEKSIANWMMPSGMRPRTHHWFQVSPDEKHVAACAPKPGEPTQRRVLDIQTGDEVDFDPDDPEAWFHGVPQDWYRRRQSSEKNGVTAVTITWPGHSVERTFIIDRNHHIWLTSAEGVVFEEMRDAESFSQLRHDLATGESRTLVRANPRSCTTISPDGERVLLNETALVARKDLPEHRGVKILDGHDGKDLGWIEAPWSVTWIGSGHRYVQTALDGKLTVFDIEGGTMVSLGTHSGTAHARVLTDGSILLQDGEDLTLHDGESGALLRRL